MPGPSIQEVDVSNYWAANYDPVMDFAQSGSYAIETDYGVVYGTMTIMTDGSIWFDHDNDGWFDVGRRYNEDGAPEEFDGAWRALDGDTTLEAPQAGSTGQFGLDEGSVLESNDWFL